VPEPAPPPGPIDRREDPGPDAEKVRAAIMSRMDAVRADIGTCLDDWSALDPGLEGQVNLAFQLGPEGLQDAWVNDHTDVPFGPLSCFSSAVYGQDWTGVTSTPLEVTMPFTFTAGEEGSAG
jgi:hypothetical protein